MPLYLYYKYKSYIGDKQYILFRKDLDVQPRFNFFTYMMIKENRNIYYLRFRPYGHIFRILAPEDNSIKSTPNIGGGLMFCHPRNSYINAISIGEYFKIYHNVTIGNNNGGLPTIGNNVSIYTGATVVGNIHIGNNVIIGAGCVVTKSVPNNCTVIGNPARIYKLNGEKVDLPLPYNVKNK